MMEENKKRKRILWILLSVGLSLSTYYAFCLISFSVDPQIVNYHIQYNNGFPQSLSMIAFLVYLIATIPPLFVSSIKRTHLMGILMFLSCAVTAFFFTQYLTSVWCFFAALISVVVLWILRDSKRKFNFDKLFQVVRQS
jgi:Na+/melibiose symporter-like transporter